MNTATLATMTIPQLKQVADSLGVAYTSKVKKDELKAALTEHLTALAEAEMRKTAKQARQSKVAPLPNSERVQKYARQHNADAPYINVFPKLTHRQMRRVLKRRTPADGLVIGKIGAHREGYSLLARTPDGLGIFHQFSN